MGKRIVSFIVIISLCASTFVGALGLSLRSAYASYADDFLYSGSIISKLEDLPNSSECISLIENFDFSDMNLLMGYAIDEETGYFAVSCIRANNLQYPQFVCDSWGINRTFIYSGGSYQFDETAITCVWAYSWNGLNYTWVNNGYNYNIRENSFPVFNLAAGVNSPWVAPTTLNFQRSDFKFYFSHDIEDPRGSVVYFENIFDGEDPNASIDFDIKSFWLGERRYLTITDQQIVIDSDQDKEFYVFEIGDSLDSERNRILLSYAASSNSRGVTLIPGGSSFVTGLTNVSPAGVYAWDITDLDWSVISYSLLFKYPSTEVSGQALNCPYYLNEEAPEPGTSGTPDSYTQLWNEYNTYVNNYNTSPVIPDQLSSALFGVNGLWSYPVSVASPHQSLNVWKWWTLEEDLGINFELMDVVMVHAGAAEYTLVYYYDHSLQVAFMPVQNLHLNELFDKFDCVIIVPDDQGELDKSTWWQSILSFLADELNLQFDFSILDNYAVSGSSSGGVQYVDSRPGNATVVLNGYIYVTPKGVQRQQLYNFSDGITKFYKLMSDYVESEDSWKTSFLQWTASWFSAINTLNGSINGLAAAISKLDLSRIEDKLDRLIENTNEEESNFWYIPLWNFVKQFEPAADDFVEGLQVYDDNWDNFPLLSPVPTIPLLPTISLGGG